MSFKEVKNLPPELVEKIKHKLLFKTLSSKEELRAWLYLFFDIEFPMGVVYPTSTHGPVEAMWRIYELIKTGDSQFIPEVAMLASRDSYKTLSASAIEVLCMVHFRLRVAHMAAIKQQSAKAVEYTNAFFRKLEPYLAAKGWKRSTDSKTKIGWITEEQEDIYLVVIPATVAGANSEHCPLLFIDEIDVIQDPNALKEAKGIPSMYKGFFPLTVNLSTRKFAGGLMEKTLKKIESNGGEILRWNILDVSRKISDDVARSNEPRVPRYVSANLPMENISVEQWEALPDKDKNKYELLEAYAGIADHPLLPVMKNYLVDRSEEDVGVLYKPVISVLNIFRGVDNDMADAQYLCNKPSLSGLVYPRFDNKLNVLSVREATNRLLGDDGEHDSFEYLKNLITNLGITIIGGGDWGYTDYTALGVLAMMPTGEVWILDLIWEKYLEIDDIVKHVKSLQTEWNIDKWYVDQNYPSYIKTLKRKAKIRCPSFFKNVSDGITALQSKIVDSLGNRRFYVIDVPSNRPIIDAFSEYRWKLNSIGEIVEGVPHHDKDGVSDIMDMLRYPAQNLFLKGRGVDLLVAGKGTPRRPDISPTAKELKERADKVNTQLMLNKINELTGGKSSSFKKKKKGKIVIV